MSISRRSFYRQLHAGLIALLMALAAPLPVLACAATDNAQRASAIANGHAFTKHNAEFVNGTVIDGLAFPLPTIANAGTFATFIEGIMNVPDQSKALINNRRAYWSGTTGTVVIYNGNADDCGTAFRPNLGFAYYTNLN